jgi:hypothetical protein
VLKVKKANPAAVMLSSPQKVVADIIVEIAV